MGRVRVIGGTHRSRVLRFNDGVVGLRPTPDRVRETLFNWLNQDLTGKVCLDLFSGSGALGFEAISRNAKRVICVEKNIATVIDLHNNQKLMGISNLEIIHKNALDYLKNCVDKFDVIFLDPPYASNLLNQSLCQIVENSVLADGGVVYIEYQTIPDLAKYNLLKHGKAGNVNYALIESKE